MRKRNPCFWLVLLPVLLVACTTARDGSDQEDPVALRETEDSFDLIHSAEIVKGKAVGARFEELPDDARTQGGITKDKQPERSAPEEVALLHPTIEAWIENRDDSEVVEVVLSLPDNITIPRFPEPAIDEPRDSATNKKALARADEIVRRLDSMRKESYGRYSSELSQRYGAEIIESFWLISAMRAQMSIGNLRALVEASRSGKGPGVRYIEPQDTGTIPPQDANNNNDVQDGRAMIVSDPYFALGQTGGWIGLLDSGMRFTHELLTSPSNVDFKRDCVNGTSNNCNSGSGLNPNDDCWNHGTSSGAIIVGNNTRGNAFQGVTGITLDSFKVFGTSFDATTGLCNGTLSAAAAVRGFQAAVAVLDRVVVAEMQSTGSDNSSISAAADAAFDAGAVVIAANGNNGPNDSTVNVPAIAHKVLGVGAVNVVSGNQMNGQSRGPAADNRIKPDIQGPNGTETASNGCGWQQNCTGAGAGSDTAYRVFGGTSGSTPYAAGAAGLLRNWLRGASFSIDPGQVYAQLILSARDPYPFDNTVGAGVLSLPVNGYAWWGKVSVGDNETIDIPINIPWSAARNFDGALWWPETAAQTHNDIDLRLVRPDGSVADWSLSGPSVFERARADGAVANGTWKVRIQGYSVTGGRQTVYWAAHVVNR
jgi:hypothetical protein